MQNKNSFFFSQIKRYVTLHKTSQYKLCKAIGESTVNFSAMMNGRRKVSDTVVDEIDKSENIHISKNQMLGWQIVDQFSDESIIHALCCIVLKADQSISHNSVLDLFASSVHSSDLKQSIQNVREDLEKFLHPSETVKITGVLK
jgi:hypothetical protein